MNWFNVPQVPLHKVGGPCVSIWVPARLPNGFFLGYTSKMGAHLAWWHIFYSFGHLFRLVVWLTQLLCNQTNNCLPGCGEHRDPLYWTQCILEWEQSSYRDAFLVSPSIIFRDFLGCSYPSWLQFKLWVPNCVQYPWTSASQYGLNGWVAEFHPYPHQCYRGSHSPHPVIVH